jgi:hypothetical protein
MQRQTIELGMGDRVSLETTSDELVALTIHSMLSDEGERDPQVLYLSADQSDQLSAALQEAAEFLFLGNERAYKHASEKPMQCGLCVRIGTNSVDGPKVHAPGCPNE